MEHRTGPGSETAEAFFEEVIERMGTGAAAYDRDGTVAYANERYAEMLRVERDELEGGHIARVNPEFDRDRFPGYWASFEPGETRRRESVHRTFDTGVEFPVDVTTTRTTIDGRAYNIGTIRDITVQKECERELRLFKQAVEHAGHTVVITDAEGHIEYVNPNFEDETGYDKLEAIGHTPRILKSGKQDEAFYEELWETILDGDVWEAELVNSRKSGELYYVDQTIAPIKGADGEITHFVSVEYDVTDRKLREKRLSELNRILRHNLRNTVTVLKANLEQIWAELDDPPEELPLESVLERINSLESTSEKAAEIRTFLKGEYAAGQTCELGSLLNDLRPEFRNLYPEAEVTVEPRDVTVGIDTETCRTVIKEVVDNAVFHNDRQIPVVEVSVADPASADGQVEIRIVDNGPGIPTEERSAVEVGEEEPLHHGSGIGLSHVHAVVTEVGGDVDIAASDPRGSVVTISLPAEADGPADNRRT
jgi:PAS domain S-box-containing protein